MGLINEYKKSDEKVTLVNNISNTYESNSKTDVLNNTNFDENIDIIGKLYIPKINLETNILSISSEEALKKSVARLCGPKIVNTQGNLCIAGHNYINNNMFGLLYKLSLNDKIYISDLNGKQVEYTIYKKYKTSPKDLSCLEANGNNDKEITLITCTVSGLERLIIRAIANK